jgi:hypothetical protein
MREREAWLRTSSSFIESYSDVMAPALPST